MCNMLAESRVSSQTARKREEKKLSHLYQVSSFRLCTVTSTYSGIVEMHLMIPNLMTAWPVLSLNISTSRTQHSACAVGV